MDGIDLQSNREGSNPTTQRVTFRLVNTPAHALCCG